MKQPGRLVLARVSPIKKRVNQAAANEPKREITLRQLCVLLYHFYVSVDNPDIGFEDCEKTASQFQAELDRPVTLSKEQLEALLWHLELCFEEGMYWNPAKENIDFFVKKLLNPNERFDRLLCQILKKPEEVVYNG